MKATASARPFPPVVVFDLDGTLLVGTTVSLLLAEWLGHDAELVGLERRFRDHEISNRMVADASAGWLADRTMESVAEVLSRAPWIAGLERTVATLLAAGTEVLVATITWRFAADWLAIRHGLTAVSGTEMEATNGILSGRVARYCDEHDKSRSVTAWCRDRAIDLADIAAVGDSRSDVPLFRRVGFSVAINATGDARAAASRTLEATDLCALLPVLSEYSRGEWRRSGSRSRPAAAD